MIIAAEASFTAALDMLEVIVDQRKVRLMKSLAVRRQLDQLIYLDRS